MLLVRNMFIKLVRICFCGCACVVYCMLVFSDPATSVQLSPTLVTSEDINLKNSVDAMTTGTSIGVLLSLWLFVSLCLIHRLAMQELVDS